mmetsp:Transcript_30034/g.96916  ORF Transcript_30034/g.96916 Transcript_30034/m.96916 type:complete len:822 (-) Transcript_30034:462-2927(-)
MAQNGLAGVLYELCSNPLAASLFLRPVIEQHPEIAAAYLKAIKRPLDLGTVVARMRAGCYTTQPERCLRRVGRVFRNCEKFNSNLPQYREAARHLRRYFDQLWRLFFEWPFEAAPSVIDKNARRDREVWLRSFIATGSSVPLSTNELTRVRAAIDGPTLPVGVTLLDILESLDAHFDAKQKPTEVEHLSALLALRCAERRARGCEFSAAWCAASSVSCTRLSNTLWPVLVLDFVDANVPRVPASIRTKLGKDIADTTSTNTLVEYLGSHNLGVLRKDAVCTRFDDLSAQMKTPKRKQDRELYLLAVHEANKAQRALDVIHFRGENDDEVAAEAQSIVFSFRHSELAMNTSPSVALRNSDTCHDDSSSDEDHTGNVPLGAVVTSQQASPLHVMRGNNVRCARYSASATSEREHPCKEKSGRSPRKRIHFKKQKPGSKPRLKETSQIAVLATGSSELTTGSLEMGNVSDAIDPTSCNDRKVVSTHSCVNQGITSTRHEHVHNTAAEERSSGLMASPSRNVSNVHSRKQSVSQRPKEPSLKSNKRDRERVVRAAKRDLVTRRTSTVATDRRQAACIKVRNYLTKLLVGRTLFVYSDRIWRPTSAQDPADMCAKTRMRALKAGPVDGERIERPCDTQREVSDACLGGRPYLHESSIAQQTRLFNESLNDVSSDQCVSFQGLAWASLCDHIPLRLRKADYVRCQRMVRRKIEQKAADVTSQTAIEEETDSESESLFPETPADKMKYGAATITLRLERDVRELEAMVSRIDRTAAARACAAAKVDELQRLKISSTGLGVDFKPPVDPLGSWQHGCFPVNHGTSGSTR